MAPARPEDVADPSPEASLRWTKVAIVVLVAGIVLAGRSNLLWPVDTWPLYARFDAHVPGPVATESELRAVARDGRVVRLVLTDLVPYDRVSALPKIVASAFADEAHPRRDGARAYLAKLVGRAVPGEEIVAIEHWRVSWKVDAFAVPPLQLDAPSGEERQGRITTRAAAESPSS